MAEYPFLTAQWRFLVMANYEVDPDRVRLLAPVGTELDSWHGRTFVSLVAFRFLDTRVLGFPVPLHRDFEEVNLRFYVRHRTESGVRRGVVFLREVVRLPIVASAARLTFNEPYEVRPTKSRVRPAPLPAVEYAWREDGHWDRCAARASGTGTQPVAGTHEQFIVEQEWGYTRQRDGGTTEYRVVHPRWTVWPADDVHIDANLADLHEVGAALEKPYSTFIADGSPVKVFAPHRIA